MDIIKRLKRSTLFKNTFIYTLLQLINSGIPFLLLPLFTRYLSRSDYGMIATYNNVIAVLAVFVGINIPGAIGVTFFHMEKKELKKYIGNGFNLLIITVILALIVVTVGMPLILQKVKLPVLWIYIAVFVAVSQMITATNLVLWRAQQRAKPFAIYSVSQTMFNIILSVLLIALFKMGWTGRTIGTSTAFVLFGILSIFFIFKRGYASINFSKEHTVDILKFGLPLIPHSIALWIRSGVNILLITSILGFEKTGLYNVGLQFGMVVGLFATAFNNAYSPYLYEKLKENNADMKKLLVKFTYLYFIGITAMALLLSTFFVWMIPYFLGKKFWGASQYIYWISIAYAFQGMYLMVVNYIFFAKKTHLLSMVTISTSLFHVGLSYVMIKQFGAIGAAYASTISFAIMFLSVWYLSAKVVKMPWFGLKN